MSEQTSRFDTTQSISFAGVWRAIKRRAWIAVATALLVGVVYGLYSVKTYRPQYTTTACFAVSIVNNYGISTNTYNSVTTAQMARTFPYILQSGTLQDVVAGELGYKTLPGVISATAVEETNLFTLKATAADPQVAYDILQSTIRNYPQIAEPLVGVTTLTLMDEDGVVEKPSNSVPWTTVTMVSLLAGCLVGAMLVVLYLMLHRTVYGAEDLKQISHVRCIASVPTVSKKANAQRTGRLITQRHIPRTFVESIYSIRAAIERSGKRVVLVTSSLAGEGKTTISVNLAISLAKNGNRVILIDADMRRPQVRQHLGISEKACRFGVSDYLTQKASIEQIGVSIANLNNLVVIPGGSSVQNASELLSTSRMKELVEIMRQQADYVIVDASPCTILADSAVLGQYVDGVLYVVRQDYASCDTVQRGIENATMGGTPLLGFALSQTEQRRIPYERYGYTNS